MLGILYFFNLSNTKINQFTYDEFITHMDNKEITEISITPRSSAGVYEIRGKLNNYGENETFYLKVPLSNEVIAKILNAEESYDFKIATSSDPDSSTLLIFILNVLPTIIILGVGLYFVTRQMGSANKSMDFGRSKARLSEQNNKVTFKNVAGLDEEKEEVAELIDFLKSPKKFQRLGARIPKANVPFYYISGSEFVELFVGVGASRVRDMFKQAKHNAPCLIFIDEIDAVGRQRGAGLGGGHDEREQTLNQLLTEMDGFGANEGIIIIAATNRPDVLDPALLRPGRFDRQVQVNLPDAKGREEILNVHAKGKTFAKNVSLKNISERTVGFSGADLENLLNEAALLAVRRNKESITMLEIDEAHDRVLMGPAKKSKKYTENDKKLVAYHEAGHAVLGIKLDGANDVQKITIIPRGYAGGYTMMLPKEERFTATKQELLERIIGLLGGRVAEELVFNEITTGAHNDFEQATKIVRSMVTEYGMSSLGPLQLEQQEGSVFLGRDYNKSRNFSGQVAYEIDQEMRKIMDDCYKKATQIIKDNRDLLDLIANTLITKETLTKEEIDYLVEHKCLPPEEDEPTLEELKNIAKELKIKGYTKMTKEELKEAIKNNE